MLSLTAIAVGGNIALPWRLGEAFFPFFLISKINLYYNYASSEPLPLVYLLITLIFEPARDSDRKQVSPIHTEKSGPENQGPSHRHLKPNISQIEHVSNF